jgi:hypothetical protein
VAVAEEALLVPLQAGVDEIASETQVSEGWTYAVLPSASVSGINAAVASGTVKHFHGKKFKKAQASDYQALLAAARKEVEASEDGFLAFTLLETSWAEALARWLGVRSMSYTVRL